LKIILTGGGTAGHVTPNFAMIPYLKSEGFEIEYIGSKNGMEKKMVEEKNIPYHGISSGKLRRYFDMKNFTDVANILKGILQANKLMKNLKPNIVFSKGGFVTVPVVIAAWMNKIPVVIHESDITPGLANKISIPFASVICTSFPEAAKNIKKSVVTGSPIRDELLTGNADIVRKMLSLNSKPIILVIGGSQGSIKINESVRKILDRLNDFQIIHICGKGNLNPNIKNKNYFQFEYITDDLPNFFAVANIIVSRAGSNSIFEFLALKKPNLLIPLSKKSSRGDQILNANSFQKQGFSKVLYEEDLNSESLLENINQLMKDKDVYIKNMSKKNFESGNKKIIELIKKYVRN
jgi:undecaprenyldiphospho-muramoylpentapeptide beta-N-acetylglucosaminyltransferase